MYVFARLAAILLLNPVFSRANIPAAVKASLVLFATIIIAPIVPMGSADNSFVEVGLGLGREFLVGFALTFVFNIYYYMLMFAADIMDTQFGMSMAKMMDPQTHIQTAITGNIMNILFMLYFFATNCHLELINVAVGSFQLIPPGAGGISLDNAAGFVFTLFSTIFILALRLALPFVAAEFILELSMGILMKLIPQIHVFVIHMQGKILLGIIALVALTIPITKFIDNYIVDMFNSMGKMLLALVN
ncbi:MAG: flagellar biosynthetic protein FliR [Ruminococcus sp.]|nr:flagellar biosynthetic protein FliR [Ruminococcus sp.]